VPTHRENREMQDLIRESVANNQIIFHEEVARDGAQGKSFLSAAERVLAATSHAEIFGTSAIGRLVFMAGFPSSSKEEFAAVREVASGVDSCYLGVAGRCSRDDVDVMIASLAGAQYGRIVVIVPSSKATAAALVHDSPQACLRRAVDVIRYAVDHSPYPVDFAMLDSNRAEPGFLAEIITTLIGAGASMGIVCDTVGALLPHQTRWFFQDLISQLPAGTPLVCHLHNDLGFGLVNTLEALGAGVLGLTSSWLGLGERAGMPPTEQLLFNLGYHFDRVRDSFGIHEAVQMGSCDLKQVVPLAHHLSKAMSFPLRTTDPIVGSGVNTISTGTPFTDPKSFQPYDPDAVLGVKRRVLLTALASKRVVTVVAAELGFELHERAADEALEWVKEQVYSRGLAVLERDEFVAFLNANSCLSSAPASEDVALAGVQ